MEWAGAVLVDYSVGFEDWIGPDDSTDDDEPEPVDEVEPQIEPQIEPKIEPQREPQVEQPISRHSAPRLGPAAAAEGDRRRALEDLLRSLSG